MKRAVFCFLPLLAVALAAPAFSDEPAVTLTIYSDNFAMIQEARELNLSRGMQEVRITDVPERIEPSSVRIEFPTSPDTVSLHEQRFEFDLAGTDGLMQRYLGRPVVITIEEGGTYRGTLLSVQPGNVILELEDGAVQVIPDRAITTLQFPALPEGLLKEPSLVLLVESTRWSSRHKAEITYLTQGMQWEAEYIAGIRKEEEGLLELSGRASIENRSGRSFQDAQLRLVAGDVHRVAVRPAHARKGMRMEAAAVSASAPAPRFEEQPLFEYHLYTLDRAVSLADRQAKQLNLFPPASVKADKEFSYDGSRDQDKVRVNLLLENTEENGLGKPLPAGRIRVYREPDDEPAAFAGEDRIGHTAVGEEVRIRLGNAFDIVGERTLLETRQVGKRSRQETVKIELRNRKEAPVTVTVIEHFRGDWKFVGPTPKVRRKEAGKVEFEVTVPEKGEQSFTYQVLYTW